jgi:hypothetical protein
MKGLTRRITISFSIGTEFYEVNFLIIAFLSAFLYIPTTNVVINVLCVKNEFYISQHCRQRFLSSHGLGPFACSNTLNIWKGQSAYHQVSTHTVNTDIHPFPKQDSNPRSSVPNS